MEFVKFIRHNHTQIPESEVFTQYPEAFQGKKKMSEGNLSDTQLWHLKTFLRQFKQQIETQNLDTDTLSWQVTHDFVNIMRRTLGLKIPTHVDFLRKAHVIEQIHTLAKVQLKKRTSGEERFFVVCRKYIRDEIAKLENLPEHGQLEMIKECLDKLELETTFIVMMKEILDVDPERTYYDSIALDVSCFF